MCAPSSAVTLIWQRHDDIIINVYDVKRMSGDMVIDIMCTHTIVLIGDVLQQNSFFVRPDQFLRERRGGGAAYL